MVVTYLNPVLAPRDGGCGVANRRTFERYLGAHRDSEVSESLAGHDLRRGCEPTEQAANGLQGV